MSEENPIVTLADGRRVAYLEVGDPGGSPVISCHGGLAPVSMCSRPQHRRPRSASG